MDCEGSEGDIFSYFNDYLANKINKIVLEFHDNMSILNHNQIINILENYKYTTKLEWDNKSCFGFIYAYKNNCE